MSSSSTRGKRPEGPVLRARQIRVLYRENRRWIPGLDGFSADVRPGITGLIGPNGAGKTTFLRTVAGLLPLRSGTLDIGGRAPGHLVAEGGVGFLPEHPVLPAYLTVEEFLTGLGESRRPRSREGPGFPRIHRCDERPGRTDVPALARILPKRMDTLSLGQRKRVALSAALLGAPEVLLLDEPTNGLDAVATRDLREALGRERRRGSVILISSHHLDELQRIADALIFLNRGRGAGAWSRIGAVQAFGTLECLFHHVFGEDTDVAGSR